MRVGEWTHIVNMSKTEQWDDSTVKTSDISIDKIVNKDTTPRVESIETSPPIPCWKRMEQLGHVCIPSFNQLCVSVVQSTPVIDVEEPGYLPSNDSRQNTKETIQEDLQQPLSYPVNSRWSGSMSETCLDTDKHFPWRAQSCDQGSCSSSYQDTDTSRRSEEKSKARKQLAKKLWRQRDQMKKEEEKQILQRKEQQLQSVLWEWMRSHSEWKEERIRRVAKTMFQNEACPNGLKGVDHMPVLQGSAFDWIPKRRHRIEQRLPPGTLEQLPEEQVRKRRNEQKSASKWRAMQLHMEKMHLLRWNCRLLEELYKYVRNHSTEKEDVVSIITGE